VAEEASPTVLDCRTGILKPSARDEKPAMLTTRVGRARHRRSREGQPTRPGGFRLPFSVALGLAIVLVATPAFAFWSATGAGSGAAATGTFPAPSSVTATLSGTANESVRWTAPVGNIAPAGYYVLRTQSGSSVAACASSPTVLISTTSCVDAPTATGSYTYTVVAVFRTWSAVSTTSAAVTFVTLPFTVPTITITHGSSYTSESQAPVISGTTSAPFGSTVTVTIGSQTLTATVQLGGSWSTTATTLPNGIYTVTASVRNLAGTGSTTQTLTIQTTPAVLNLKSAGTYSVLAGGAITSTGKSVLNGDVGTSPGGSLVGFPPATYTGSSHVNDAISATAAADLSSAIADATTRHIDTEIAGDLNGLTFHAGVYHSAAAIAVTGTLTLDAQNDPNAVFIIVGDAAVNTAAASSISLVNGARASQVFWVAVGAVGIGANSSFSGVILTQGAITIGALSSVDGRALTHAAATLSSNTVSRPE
jgi:hypothetical protein